MSKSKGQHVTLFRGFKPSKEYVVSPFVTKVEFRLRYSNSPYSLDFGSPLSGPKGKIPYVHITPTDQIADASTDSIAEVIKLGDSAAIISHLISTDSIPDLNSNLTPSQKLEDFSIRALLEEKLYFYNGHERWTENYYAQRDTVLQAVPWPMRIVVGIMVSRRVIAMLNGQGVGRHTAEENAATRREMWEMLDAALEGSRAMSSNNEPFWILGGKEPTEADASLFAFISSVLIAISNPSSQGVVKGCANLMDYAERIHSHYFSDYAKWS